MCPTWDSNPALQTFGYSLATMTTNGMKRPYALTIILVHMSVPFERSLTNQLNLIISYFNSRLYICVLHMVLFFSSFFFMLRFSNIFSSCWHGHRHIPHWPLNNVLHIDTRLLHMLQCTSISVSVRVCVYFNKLYRAIYGFRFSYLYYIKLPGVGFEPTWTLVH